jgi:rod shape-determining protein MreD
MYFAMVMILVVPGAALLQSFLPGWPLLAHARFPVLLAVTLYYALNYKPWVAMIAAFWAGLIQDSLSFVPLGYSSMLFCMVGLIAGRYRKKVLSDAVITAIFFGGIATLGVTLLLYLLLKINNLVACSGTTAALRIFSSGILGLVTAPAVFLVLTVVHRGLDLIEREDADV